MTTTMPRPKPKTQVAELATFPEKLKLARKEAGLTLTALSEKTGIDTSQLSRFERGERLDGIQMATVIRLARALGRPTGWFAGDDAHAPIPVFREPGPPSGTDRRSKPRRT